MEQKLLNLTINTGTYQSFVSKITSFAAENVSANVCFVNVHMLVEINQDEELAKSINSADMLAPDGMPILWALKSLYGIRQERVAGMDIVRDVFAEANLHKFPVFIYGGTQKEVEAVSTRARNDFPGIIIAGAYSPPFRELSKAEQNEVIEMINQSGAKIVFVALGCPKQESWMARMKGSIHAVMLGVGGALPVYAGLRKRAPKWMQNAGLEWFFRFLMEPRRLFRRYAVTNIYFIKIFMLEYFRQKFGR